MRENEITGVDAWDRERWRGDGGVINRLTSSTEGTS